MNMTAICRNSIKHWEEMSEKDRKAAGAITPREDSGKVVAARMQPVEIFFLIYS